MEYQYTYRGMRMTNPAGFRVLVARFLEHCRSQTIDDTSLSIGCAEEGYGFGSLDEMLASPQLEKADMLDVVVTVTSGETLELQWLLSELRLSVDGMEEEVAKALVRSAQEDLGLRPLPVKPASEQALVRTQAKVREDARAGAEASTEYFVAHEFTPDKTDDLRGAIDKALADSGLTPYYADNEVKEGHIFTDKILPKIRSTRFGIYDLSNPDKANVFMELGAAIAMGRRYFIICERGTKLPSDVLGLDRIEYDSYVHLTRELKAKVADALRGAS